MPGLPGRITAIDQRFVNLGRREDPGHRRRRARQAAADADFGRFRVALTGTYYIKYDVQQPDGSFAGFVSNALRRAGHRHHAALEELPSVNWDYGPWSATLGNTYQSSYIDVQTDPDGNLRRVGALSLWDLQGTYTGFKNLTLTLGVKNLMDQNPPLTNANLRSRAATTRRTTTRARGSSTAPSSTRSSNRTAHHRFDGGFAPPFFSFRHMR